MPSAANESKQSSILEEFLKSTPLKESISIPAVFYNPVGGMKHSNFGDLLCTFTGYLLSECIWVPASVERTEYGKFRFSDLGKRMMVDYDKMTVFIKNFLIFYNKKYV